MSKVRAFTIIALLVTMLAPLVSNAAINARNNPNCKLTSRTCLSSGSRWTGYSWQWRSCWKWRDNYNCGGSFVNHCQPYINRGCGQIGNRCTASAAGLGCTTYTRTYRCLQSKGAAFNDCTPLINRGCTHTSLQACNQTWCVNIRNQGGTATQHTYQCLDKSGVAFNNCTLLINKGCKRASSTLVSTRAGGGATYNNTYQCLDKASTKFDNCTNYVSKGCKLTNTSTTRQPPAGYTNSNTYKCLDRAAAAFDQCKSLLAKGCKQLNKTCIFHKKDGTCGTYDLTFQCLSKKGTSSVRKICKSAMCVSGSCFKMNSPPSTDFLPSVAKLSIATAAGKSLSASGGVSIFKGTPQHCNKVIFGLKNCCKHTPSKSCPASATALDNTRQARQGIFVGTFCAVKAFFGACLRKQEVWCGFPSKLARIIQKAGRAQLGISWGVPKAPNCRGFTPQELQRIDFSKIDLSALYADILAKMKPMVQGALGNRVSGHIQGYFNSGAKTSGKMVP